MSLKVTGHLCVPLNHWLFSSSSYWTFILFVLGPQYKPPLCSATAKPHTEPCHTVSPVEQGLAVNLYTAGTCTFCGVFLNSSHGLCTRRHAMLQSASLWEPCFLTNQSKKDESPLGSFNFKTNLRKKAALLRLVNHFFKKHALLGQSEKGGFFPS